MKIWKIWISSRILCASQTYIKGINFHNEIQNCLNFLYQNLGPNPPPWKQSLLLLLLLSLQLCLTLCNSIKGSPPGSAISGILHAGELDWVAISFSNVWKWKVKLKSLSCVWFFMTPWTAAYQAPPSMGFSKQEYRSVLSLPSPHGGRDSPYFTFEDQNGDFPVSNVEIAYIS